MINLPSYERVNDIIRKCEKFYFLYCNIFNILESHGFTFPEIDEWNKPRTFLLYIKEDLTDIEYVVEKYYQNDL